MARLNFLHIANYGILRVCKGGSLKIPNIKNLRLQLLLWTQSYYLKMLSDLLYAKIH
jgi:hypothetical protein